MSPTCPNLSCIHILMYSESRLLCPPCILLMCVSGNIFEYLWYLHAGWLEVWYYLQLAVGSKASPRRTSYFCLVGAKVFSHPDYQYVGASQARTVPPQQYCPAPLCWKHKQGWLQSFWNFAPRVVALNKLVSVPSCFIYQILNQIRCHKNLWCIAVALHGLVYVWTPQTFFLLQLSALGHTGDSQELNSAQH